MLSLWQVTHDVTHSSRVLAVQPRRGGISPGELISILHREFSCPVMADVDSLLEITRHLGGRDALSVPRIDTDGIMQAISHPRVS